MIPPLIIQTIVENVFVHAFDFHRTGNKLWLRVSELNSKLIIEVDDNGKGISKNRLQEIYDSKADGIGIKSTLDVISRLPRSKMEIMSNIGEGTLVRIEISDMRKVIK